MSPSRPVDPIVEARQRGRFLPEASKSQSSPRRRGRPQQARAPPDEDDDACDAYDIPTFCRRHKISESFYFKLRLQGLAPRTMKIGKRVLISRESARRWREEREQATAPAPAASGFHRSLLP